MYRDFNDYKQQQCKRNISALDYRNFTIFRRRDFVFGSMVDARQNTSLYDSFSTGVFVYLYCVCDRIYSFLLCSTHGGFVKTFYHKICRTSFCMPFRCDDPWRKYFEISIFHCFCFHFIRYCFRQCKKRKQLIQTKSLLSQKAVFTAKYPDILNFSAFSMRMFKSPKIRVHNNLYLRALSVFVLESNVHFRNDLAPLFYHLPKTFQPFPFD